MNGFAPQDRALGPIRNTAGPRKATAELVQSPQLEVQMPAVSIAATTPIVSKPCLAAPAAIWQSDRLTNAQAARLTIVRTRTARRLQECTVQNIASNAGAEAAWLRRVLYVC